MGLSTARRPRTLALLVAWLACVLLGAHGASRATAAQAGEIAVVRTPACWLYVNGCTVLGNSIRLIRADGSGERELMGNTLKVGPLAWSPDGRTLAFARPAYQSPGRYVEPGLFLLEVDGGRVRSVVRGAEVGIISWSPDGGRLAFDTYGGDEPTRIDVVDADGSDRRVFARRASDPAWSPDCSEIAYRTRPPDVEEIRAAPATGHGPLRVIRRRAGGGLHWAPDGRRLAFVDLGAEDGRPRLRVMDADGGRERALTDGSSPSWSPDGRAIAFSDPIYNLRVLEVDAADPRGTERLVTATAATGFWDAAPEWRPQAGATRPGVCDELDGAAQNRPRPAGLRRGRRCSPRRQAHYRRHGFVCRRARDGRYRLVPRRA